MIFAGSLDIFRLCTSSLRCRKTNSRLTVRSGVFRRALRCGGRVPRKISNAPLREDLFPYGDLLKVDGLVKSSKSLKFGTAS